MAVRRIVYKRERIVPVRFSRCAAAVPANTYAPDPDDRGYTGYHGPVVGVCRDDRARIRVLRDLLDPNAPLYVTSEDPSKLQIRVPAAGQPLPGGGHADIEFVTAGDTGDVKVQVRAQAADGPIVAELTVHISRVTTIRCAAHRTAIYAPPGPRSAANTTTRSFAGMRALIAEVNRQWRPAGISFNVDTWKDDTNLTNQVPRNGVNPVDGILLCPIYGTSPPTPNENFDRLMNTNKVANRLNIYFVRQIQAPPDPATGVAPNYIGFGSSSQVGLVVSDNLGDLETEAHTVSHELGHILTLAGSGHATVNDSHSDDDPRFDITVANRRHDLWSRRRLMYYMVGLQAADRTGSGGRYSFAGTDAGYGEGRSGHMITIKNLTGDPTDNEYTDARNKARTLP